jgi:predicted ATP-dependent endonuclease of OLD family
MPKISVKALISDRGGHPIEPELQGHGLQRALVIALLHELAESGAATEAGSVRGLMLAIEEPELYQHPLQARALAASLERLAGDAGGRPIQVAYSTHSPFFTSPALFADLRLCRRVGDGGTTCVAADPEAITAAIAESGYSTDAGQRVKRALAESLREAIFARSVILCEGVSDQGVLTAVGDLQGGLDRDGVAIASMGDTKSALIMAVAILRQLNIPFIALFDADKGGGLDASATLNRQILTVCGEEPEGWPGREVRENSANYEDTMESDLVELWPTFAAAREELVGELGVKPNSKEYRLYYEAARRAGEPPGFLVDVLEAARERSR